MKKSIDTLVTSYYIIDCKFRKLRLLLEAEWVGEVNKKIFGIVLGILVVIVIIFNLLQQGEQNLNLTEVGGIVADNTDFTFNLDFYKEDVDDMRPATLSSEEKDRFAVLIRDSEVTETSDGRPIGVRLFADLSLTDNTGNYLGFGVYKSHEGNDLYVNLPFGMNSDRTKFYKMETDEMYEFLSSIKEKTPS